MKIKRRVKGDNGYKEIVEEVTLIKRNSKTVLVRLDTGDIIKRKNKDIIDNNEKGKRND